MQLGSKTTVPEKRAEFGLNLDKADNFQHLHQNPGGFGL